MFHTPARDVHVHIWPAGSPETLDYLLLRSWLRTHADDRQLYEAQSAPSPTGTGRT